MKQLSPKARAMLDALQTVDSPAAGIETRAWSAVVARTAAGDLGPQIPADAPVSTAAATSGLAKTLVLVVGVAAIATAIGVGVATTREDPSAVQRMVARPVVVAAPAPAVDDDDEPELVAPESEPELVPEPVEPAPTKARPRAKADAKTDRPVVTPPSDGPDALEKEMRLMSEARAALGAGDAGRAIGLLKDHAKQFPRGAFVLEREVSWITALCALGKTDAARTRADGFLRKHGKHPLAAKVRASCGGTVP